MRTLYRHPLVCRLVAAVLMLDVAGSVMANPTGMTVHSGSATATSSGSQLTVTTTSQNTVLNWQSFNIGDHDITVFQEPSSTSIVWNQINNANPSQIYGSLQANGIVVLLNSSGFYFGPNSFVSAAGLVVSTANCPPPQNSGGGWEFNGPPPLASIVNYGQIKIGNGGSAFLIADQIENHGSITAPGGTIGLVAGQTVLLSDRPDGRGMSMAVTLPSGSVDNEGRLVADGGTIAMNAKVVNQNGFIQANSVRNHNGVIELVASDQLTLGANSQIIASGDDSASGSAGGDVMLKSGNDFSDSVGSQITVNGGTQGGNGGNVEISAPNVLSLNSSINASAQRVGRRGNQRGWTAGKLLLDPGYIILDTSGPGSAGSGTVLAGNNPGSTLDLNVNSAFAKLAVSQIILQAMYDITLSSGTSWDLSGTIGANFGGVTSGQLKLEAGRNIIFGDGALISDANNWSVTLMAGVNNFNTGAIQTGAGNIYLNGGPSGDGVGGSIQTASGTINLMAGDGIQIGSGMVSSSAGNITWQAGGDIQFGDGSQISDGSGLVTLDAGYNFANNAVNFNVGNIYLNGGPNGDGVGGSIQTVSGDISLTVGQDILVGSGYVITTGRGSIYAQALAGNIDTGSDAQGYFFRRNASSLSTAYDLSDGLGGISTEAGGNVTLIAGGDVTSVLPGNGGYYYDGNLESPNNADYLTAGSGAYGSQLGNVTIVAGGNVTGNYLVANGKGAIYAGVKMVNGIPVDANGNPVTDGKSYVLDSSSTGSAGTSDNELALNLIAGGWTVNAAQDIYLQEVRNPNGVFDINGGHSFAHYFDYAASDYVDLNAGNLVQLGASPSVLPRPSGIKVPFIYPSILNITAGAGGVELVGGSTDPFNQLILFPSPQGSLTINTTDGGSLAGDLASSGGIPQIFNLIVSDSGLGQYTASGNFGINDHAASPVHLDASTPIALNLSGDMSLVFLDAPEAAQINVVGNMYNCRFQGMNLSANDVTSINVGLTAEKNMEDSGILNAHTDGGLTVGGDIFNRGAFSSVTLDLTQTGVQAPDMAYLSEAVNNAIGSTSISAATLTTSLYYNKDTHALTYENISGVSIASILNLLQNLTVQVYKNNIPQFDSNGNPITTTASVLTSATAQALLAQYNAENAYSGLPAGSGPPDGTYGFTIGGGGQFNITARTIDLGTTAGIQSDGVGLYTFRGSYPLASLFGNGGVFDHGADITITTTGNHSEGEIAGDLVGDLDMYSSSIASLQGGNIIINAGGDINAGSADFSVNTASARGIYSTDLGDVFVYANGDINVNGSRIGVFDTRPNDGSMTLGGSVTVVSRNDNINAGSGGSGFVNVSSFEVNSDQSVNAKSLTIPGSGIMAVSYSQPGNILVEAPNGSVNAAAGGIIQLALTGAPLPEGTSLFGVPLNHTDLANMFDLALTGNMKASLDLQKVLNGNPGNSAVDVFAGYELLQLDGSGNPIVDAYGNPVITALNLPEGTLVKTSDNQDITATGSGVLGYGTINMNASGDITGIIFGKSDVNAAAGRKIIVHLIAVGTANLTAPSFGNSQVYGLQGVDATGDTSDASLFSNDQVNGGQNSMAAGTAADAASQGAASEDSVSPVKSDDTAAADDDVKKKGKAVATVQKAGRVTVILAPRQQSKIQTPEPRT